MHFDVKNPHEFIERVKEVINTQFRKEDRTVFGRLRNVDLFKKTTIYDKEEFVEESSSQCSSKQGLPLSPKD